MLDTDTLKQLAFVFNDAAKNTSSALGQSLFSDLASAFLRGAERAFKEDRDAHESLFEAFDEDSENDSDVLGRLANDANDFLPTDGIFDNMTFVVDAPELEEAEER